ncbi:MAG TPA: LamG domain-containing protein [Candidatus Brocadiia bacterium]|nr:LamG domain-containing protein [Candidatus Brocadiia bacterium]
MLSPKLPSLLAVMTSFCLGTVAGGADDALIAHWTFDEGNGGILHDRSGNGHDGRLQEAQWVKTPTGHALEFGSRGGFVDFGKGELGRLRGDMTFCFWFYLDASPFPDDRTNYVLIESEEYTKSGMLCRVEGGTGKIHFRTNNNGKWTGGCSSRAVANRASHHVVVVVKGSEGMFILDGMPCNSFPVGDAAEAVQPFRISSDGQPFKGRIEDVKIYGRALSLGEIMSEYLQGAGPRGMDANWIGRIGLRSFIYPKEAETTIEADLRGVLPLAAERPIVAEIQDGDGKKRHLQKQEAPSQEGLAEFHFKLDDLAAGNYLLRVSAVTGAGEAKSAENRFAWPLPEPVVPQPSEMTVPSLPERRLPPVYSISVSQNGGAELRLKDRVYRVDSSFSFPNGGFNHFPSDTANEHEPSWKSQVKRLNDSTWEIKGEGASYSIARQIIIRANRASFSDRIVNKSADALGVVFRNRLTPSEGGFSEGCVAGIPATAAVPETTINRNPTVFLKDRGTGLGLIALDDVFIVQSQGSYDGGSGAIGSNEFALAPGEDYTLEWAVYPTESGDYYDFINEARSDEGRNNVTVEGCFAIHDRRKVPSEEFVRLRGIKYLCGPCLSHAADDPEVSIEGIEFRDFPKERALLREVYSQTHAKFPDLKLMFHVAHSLYATNKPESVFPDARVTAADGRQVTYPYPYEAYTYFSRQRVEENWRWWIYYPTLDNSFGPALLKSIDQMLDEIGVSGAFMDGFLWGYGSPYTYDRWCGHTADIDPKTKLITRKKGSVLLLSQPAMVEFVKKMNSRGGVLIANGAIITRTIGSMNLIFDAECLEGPHLHLTSTPCCLGDPGSIRSETDIWRDVHQKLRWGNLYFYYGENDLVTRRSAPSEMYPITVDEIRSGIVKGRERIVTAVSGVYGWRGENFLHYNRLYDARGREIPCPFVTTVDADGARTRVELADMQMAIVKKIPVMLSSESPLNVIVTQYDAQGVTVLLNGNGKAGFRLLSGDFQIVPGSGYRLEGFQPSDLMPKEKDMLEFTVDINGQSRLLLTRQ